MKKRIMCAVIASAMIAAAAMTSAVYAEDAAAAVSESSAKLTRGVYAAYADKDGDGKYDDLHDYYVFASETEGHTTKPGTGMGVPFAAEQNGTSMTFHFGGADDNTKAEIKDADDGDLLITITYDEDNVQTYRLSLLTGADPDTFSGEDEETAKDDIEYVIGKGVWAAYGEDKVTDYYIFYDEKSGRTAKPDSGLGLPFSVEQVGDGTATFHFGSAENETPAEITFVEKDVYTVKLTGGDGESVTYTFRLEADKDPDTFMKDETEAYLKPGVYAAYASKDDPEVYDDLDAYYCFTSETGGSSTTPIMGTGLPFEVEQYGTSALFHFASADDNTSAVIAPLGDGTFLVNFTYDDGSSTVNRFVPISGADPETFNGAAYYYGTFETTDEGRQLYAANREFGYLTTNPRADEVVLTVNYAQPLLNGFDIDFTYTLADKGTGTYNISHDGEIDNDTILINLKELIAAAGIDAENIVSFTVNNKDNGTIAFLGFMTEPRDGVKITIADTSSDTAAAVEQEPVQEQNPKTGVAGMGAFAAAAGLAALISKKRKQSK